MRALSPWQQLTGRISDRTPGSNGQKLLTPHSGYLVPAKDIEGRITGLQIRNRATGEGKPKYPWLSTRSRPANLNNGELPITYAAGNGSAVNVCEGILKPLVAAERHGAQFIGAAGGNFASSPQQLTAFLRTLNPETVILCPDGGAVANRQVMHQYGLLAELTESLGYALSVRWWGQFQKADGDVDEITSEKFESAQLISWAEFVGKAEPTQQQPQKRQTKKEWLAQQRIERDRKSYAKIAAFLDIKTSIDVALSNYKETARDTFYKPLKKQLKYETYGDLISGFASEIKPVNGERSLIAYDCSQGTGKSNNALIPAALRVAKGDGRVLIIVPTRGLAREFKGRINDRAGEDIAATHLDTKYYSAAIVVTCPESTYKFKGQNFELIQIDEANEVLHRIESAELGNAGPQSLTAFRQLIATTQTVAIATAAMSGRTLAAVQVIGGFTPSETRLQRRARPATEMNIIEYGNFYQWLQKIIDALHSGQRVSIPIGSQGKGRMIDRFLRAFFPHQNGLVIDGAATLQNQRSRFLSDPDEFLSIERPDWFIYTPVINSGVSIEEQHFDIQFEYATPHEGAQSISQRGERVRSAIGRDGAITERHIYFSAKGAPTLEAYPDALTWQYWADELADEANAPVGAAAALAKALGAEKSLKPMEQDAERFAGMRPDLPHFLALKAFEIIYKKELLHEDWAQFGWNVLETDKPGQAEAEQLERLKARCERIQIGLIEQKGRTLRKAKTRESEGDIEEISNPFQAARAAKLQLEKLLGKDYLSQQNDDFFTAWAADKSASNPGVRAIVRSQLLHIAITDPECWEQIEQMKALKFLAGKPETDSELFWHLPELPAAARDVELVSIISRCPGVSEVLRGEVEKWTNKDPRVIAAGLYLIAHSKQIAANTKKVGLNRGAKFSAQMHSTSLFNKALEMMGHTPKKDKREGSGNRLNEYRLEVLADVENALTEAKEKGKDGLKLFRAELRVVRAQTRASIDVAAKNQIIKRALRWVSDEVAKDVEAAITGIKRRHADLIDSGLSKLGDVLNLGADGPQPKPRQMALMNSDSAQYSLGPPK